MKKLTAFLPVFTLALAFLVAQPASAQVFFGEDNDGGGLTRASLTNASAAEALFLGSLSGVTTESFESFSRGSTAPLGLTFSGTATATLTGGGCVSNWTWSACSNQVTNGSASSTGTNGFGRYPISGDNYWETDAANFAINFSNPIAAFGFYGIDIGDISGTLSLRFLSGGSLLQTKALNLTGTNGNAAFWGLIDTSNLFDRVEFVVSGGGGDVFAFDDMTIGTAEQVSVPEPGALLLLSAGLVGMAAVRRRRRDEA